MERLRSAVHSHSFDDFFSRRVLVSELRPLIAFIFIALFAITTCTTELWSPRLSTSPETFLPADVSRLDGADVSRSDISGVVNVGLLENRLLAADVNGHQSFDNCTWERSPVNKLSLAGRYLVLGPLRTPLVSVQKQIAEALLLARNLKRTLVLPRKAAETENFPFCHYFDPSGFGEIADWITESQFLSEAARPLEADVNIVLKTTKQPCPQEERKGTVCIDISKTEEDSAVLAKLVSDGQVLRVENLSDNEFLQNVDKEKGRLDFAQELRRKADRVVDQIGGPFLAIHWRTVPCLRRKDCRNSQFAECTEALMNRAKHVLRKSNLNRVFISTDAVEIKSTTHSLYYPNARQMKQGVQAIKAVVKSLSDGTNRTRVYTLENPLPGSSFLDFPAHEIVRILIANKSAEILLTDYPCSGWDEKVQDEILGAHKKKENNHKWEIEDNLCVQEPYSRKHGMRTDKFVLVNSLSEQLSKAKRHLAEVMALARALNRTLVLPNVGDSMVGVIRSNPFCHYLDPERVGDFVDWISTRQYLVENSHGKEKKPTGFLLALKKPVEHADCDKTMQPFDWWDLQKYAEVDPSQRFCIDQPGTFHGVDPEKLKSTENRILKALQTKAQNATVIIVQKAAYEEFLTPQITKPAFQNIEYARQHHERAENLLKQLGPGFLAVHWRMEKCLENSECTPALLKKCANSLLKSVSNFQKEENPSLQIFFATDAPYQKAGLKGSQSFRGEWEPLASQTLVPILRKLKPILWENVDKNVRNMDSGVQAILDKIVMSRAEWFLAAKEPCSGWSSFVDEIVAKREELGMEHVVDKWGGGIEVDSQIYSL